MKTIAASAAAKGWLGLLFFCDYVLVYWICSFLDWWRCSSNSPTNTTSNNNSNYSNTRNSNARVYYHHHHQPPSKKEIIKVVIKNQILVNLSLAIAYDWWLYRYLAYEVSSSPPPGWSMTSVWQLSACVVVEDVLFYIAHYTLHWNLTLYKNIHSIHHRLVVLSTMATIYAHPLEHFFGNILPVVLGPMIMKVDVSIMRAWFIVANLRSLCDHSGISFGPLNQPHLSHHKLKSVHFGVVGFTDILLGTTTTAIFSPGSSPASAFSLLVYAQKALVAGLCLAPFVALRWVDSPSP
jgi:sterol desaturase/sphingolipid hydroxylase (fatty acid hydroxylase superfamily)